MDISERSFIGLLLGGVAGLLLWKSNRPMGLLLGATGGLAAAIYAPKVLGSSEKPKLASAEHPMKVLAH